MACASCVEVDAPGWTDYWLDVEGCLRGQVYGPCDHEACGGLCEWVGECRCACHAAARREHADS